MLEAKKINLGILAHVDAGKTTLAEAILYRTGTIAKAGRVDHQDAFLDTDETERRRGITIFSKMAQFSLGERQMTLVDTPGHEDFSAEMERTLSVLDYALLLISGPDGIQGHTLTLWNLLRRYEIPTFLFINKMDLPGKSPDELMAQLQEQFSPGCCRFGEDILEERILEEAALADEDLLEAYLDGKKPGLEEMRSLVIDRKLFPCWFGSALKLEGVDTLLDGLSQLIATPLYPEEFAARVFKVTRDPQKNRLTWLKVTGGELKVRQEIGGEKIDQIRIWSGDDARQVPSADAGEICAVTGLSGPLSGSGLGAEKEEVIPILEPVTTCQVLLPEEADVHETFLKLTALEEEFPEIHLKWNREAQQISIQLMGEVQTQILQEMIRSRLGLEVGFGEGAIVYKETITRTVEGVGHFEPLRHYAEVHLLMEPAPRGSGLSFQSACSTDDLDLNWQRLVLTHLEEKKHLGVLTGSELTDVSITLVAGKAHLKHTEGGDFRQAVYRAVRQGLMKTTSLLLEPVYAFTLGIPNDCIGRAMTDLERMKAVFTGPIPRGEVSVFEGKAPAVLIGSYRLQVVSYTGGRGSLTLSPAGFEPCHNQEEIIEAKNYRPDADTENPSGSVFCSHGAGIFIPWNEVEEHMHLPAYETDDGEEEEESGGIRLSAPERVASRIGPVTEDEIKAIFEQTYRTRIESRRNWKRTKGKSVTHYSAEDVPWKPAKKQPPKPDYLLVDGYNIIYAWPELKALAQENLDAARIRLADMLCNYQGYKGMTLILVFDAYKVSGGVRREETYHNIHMVYTAHAETADAYIERTVHQIGKKGNVTVATSDGAEQVIIFGAGARRMSARELKSELDGMMTTLRSEYLKG